MKITRQDFDKKLLELIAARKRGDLSTEVLNYGRLRNGRFIFTALACPEDILLHKQVFLFEIVAGYNPVIDDCCTAIYLPPAIKKSIFKIKEDLEPLLPEGVTFDCFEDMQGNKKIYIPYDQTLLKYLGYHLTSVLSYCSSLVNE